ncbi:32056_t:CDS:2, partial [Gigaspora margarita]
FTDLHQDSKTSDRNIEGPGHQIDCLLRRYLNNSGIKKTSTRTHTKGLWHARIPWLHNQQEKVATGTVKSNRIPRIQHTLSRDDIYNSTKESKRHLEIMQKARLFSRALLRDEHSNKGTGLEQHSAAFQGKQATTGPLDKEPRELE